MSKYHNVVDASALVKKYRQETGWEVIQDLFRREDCAIHVLNTTIPEVVGVFARWELEKVIPEGEWLILRDLFINDIGNYQVIIHNVTDRNIEATDDIWKKSMSVAPPNLPTKHDEITCPKCAYVDKQEIKRKKPRVGSVDVMVLSVCSELRSIFTKTYVYLFTSDGHMLKIADKLRINTCDPEKDTTLPF